MDTNDVIWYMCRLFVLQLCDVSLWLGDMTLSYHRMPCPVFPHITYCNVSIRTLWCWGRRERRLSPTLYMWDCHALSCLVMCCRVKSCHSETANEWPLLFWDLFFRNLSRYIFQKPFMFYFYLNEPLSWTIPVLRQLAKSFIGFLG